MSHDHSLESSLSAQPPPMTHQVTSTDDKPDPDVIGKIKPEHPIAIDTVFRRISHYLDSADLMSCAQIWWNCYHIMKEIFTETDKLTVSCLSNLNHEVTKEEAQYIGHLCFQYFGYVTTPEIYVNLLTKHPKLKYFHQLSFIYRSPGYFNVNVFRNLMRRVGHRLQTLCVKVPNFGISYYNGGGNENPKAQQHLFPIYYISSKDNGKIILLECKNMRKIELCCNDMENGFAVSITGIALTFPNLVELHLKGVFSKNLATTGLTSAAGLFGPTVSRPESRQQLCYLRKLIIFYEFTHFTLAKLHLGILNSMELKLKHLELLNISQYANLEVMEFLETLTKTLEVLKLTACAFSGPTAGKFQKFILPETFLKLEEITLTGFSD